MKVFQENFPTGKSQTVVFYFHTRAGAGAATGTTLSCLGDSRV